MDPYAPCPCGSGKKVKFCCHKLVPEMEKIERLQDNQPELALQHLDRLEEKFADNPWIVTTRAGTLMHIGNFKDAKLALLKFLKAHPDHPRANALYGFASLQVDGFPASKKAVHRAFKRCVTESPRIVSALMEALGQHHLLNGNVLAARAHFMLAMRVAATEEQRKEMVGTIMRIDADPGIPFPLRGGHHLPAYTPPAAAQELVDKARRLSLLACWEEAAGLLEQASQSDPESAPLWHTIGLFRAWDGDEKAAAAALHKAARLYGDEQTAVECETLAQLIDSEAPAQSRAVRMKRYKLASVSQLLSRLDEQPRFVRSEEAPTQETVAGDPVATYLLLDRPLPARDSLGSLAPEDVPLYHGRVLVFDAVPEDDLPALAFVSGLEGEDLDALQGAFTAAAGELASPISDADLLGEAVAPDAADQAAERDVLGRIPVEELPLHRNYFIPPGSPGHVRRTVQDAHWKQLLEEAWPVTPQAALGGKSPLQAAGDPSLRIPLRAALNVLDVFFDERAQLLPVGEVRERLQLDPPAPPETDEQTIIPMLSSFDLLRLDMSKLTNRQLNQLVERLSFSRHARLLREALREFVERKWEDDDKLFLTPESAAATLMALAADARQYEEALQWAERGRTLAGDGSENAFERGLTWKLREMRVRVALGRPDELRGLLTDLWENYGAKLPGLRTQLMEAVTLMGIDPPWESAIVTADSLSSATSWAPSETVPAGDSSKKLWLPGQD
jgi:tetratricopeptide (TPR) repeat protein